MADREEGSGRRSRRPTQGAARRFERRCAEQRLSGAAPGSAAAARAGRRALARQLVAGRGQDDAESLLLKYDNKIDAFICNNDGLASGVIAALEAEGLADSSKVFVAGADADRRNIRWVAEGVQAVDVWKEIKPLAFQAADAALRLAQDPGKSAAELFPNVQMIANGSTTGPDDRHARGSGHQGQYRQHGHRRRPFVQGAGLWAEAGG